MLGAAIPAADLEGNLLVGEEGAATLDYFNYVTAIGNRGPRHRIRYAFQKCRNLGAIGGRRSVNGHCPHESVGRYRAARLAERDVRRSCCILRRLRRDIAATARDGQERHDRENTG